MFWKVGWDKLKYNRREIAFHGGCYAVRRWGRRSRGRSEATTSSEDSREADPAAAYLRPSEAQGAGEE